MPKRMHPDATGFAILRIPSEAPCGIPVRRKFAEAHRCQSGRPAIRKCVFTQLRNSVRRAALEKMAIAMLRHPLRPFEVTLPGAPCPLGFLRWIDVQHYARHLGPIRALGVGVEEAEIGDQVFLVVSTENVSLGSLVVNGRI